MHTLASNLVHCVFSTKDRADLIPNPERLRQYLTGIARAKNIPILSAGGTQNHLHLLLALPPAIPLAKVVQELKGNTSRWLNQSVTGFGWQRGYGAFSVSESRRQAVIAYIAGQEEHHRKWTFEQEFMTLLRKSKIEFDPQFVFGCASAVPGALTI
jgi:putative transposase